MSNGYPFIFVHGFAGWGDKDKLTKYLPYFGGFHRPGIAEFLKDRGYESYAPSLGPWSSAWDRSCELFAQIVGGTVDYGKAHSEKHGHARYGRTYEGYLKDWGQPGAHEKINLIGHSFGGPTLLMFSHLMTAGSEQEREATPPEELSPLFKGGYDSLINSITTLSGTNNGTTLSDAALELHVDKAVNWLILGLSTIIGETRIMKYYDMRLYHFGISAVDPEHTQRKFRGPKACKEAVNRYIANHFDNSLIAQSVQLSAELNPKLSISDNIYYFAYPACKSHRIGKLPFQAMELKSFPLAHLGQLIIGWFNSPNLSKNYGVNPEWYNSDGIVNTITELGPFDKPYEQWTTNTTPVPGKWYNMPVEHKDHFSWMGFFENVKVYREYFLDLAEFLNHLPPVK